MSLDREKLADRARAIAETLAEAEDWDGTERGDEAWAHLEKLVTGAVE